MQDKAIKSTDSRVFLSTKQCRKTQRTKAVDENSAKILVEKYEHSAIRKHRVFWKIAHFVAG